MQRQTPPLTADEFLRALLSEEDHTYPDTHPSGETSPTQTPTELRAMQYNAHRSYTVHNHLLSDPDIADFQILFIVEPYINPGGSPPESSHWRLVRPNPHSSDERPRSIIYIRDNIPSTHYNIIPSPHRDITAVAFPCPTLDSPITFINVYNPPSSFSTLPLLQPFLESAINPDSAFVILGDFNLHHPLWDLPERTANSEPESETLLDIMQMWGATLQSQPGIETFHNSSGHTSVIDLVFTSAAARERYIRCQTSDERDYDLGSDHIPILHTIDLSAELPTAGAKVRYNWDEADWPEMRATLTHALRDRWAQPQQDQVSIDRAVEVLTETIQGVIEAHVPKTRPSKYSKPWWNRKLNDLKTERNRTRRIWKRTKLPEDKAAYEEVLKEWRAITQELKRGDWRRFLAEVDDDTVFLAARFANTARPTRHIPPIRRQDGSMVTSSVEQADVFREAFFTDIPEPDLSDIDGGEYSDPHNLEPLKIEELDAALTRMASNKAPGPDGIPTQLLKHMWDVIREPLFQICQAAYATSYYPRLWKIALTAVVPKPQKPDYSKVNAYRPIALLNTLSKLFESALVERISQLVEQHQLLPPTHFGCRPGRSTTDALTTVTQVIKNEWRKGNVVSTLQIDVQSAFTTVNPDRLIHNMRQRGIPPEITALLTSFLSDRSTAIKVGDHKSTAMPCTVGIPQGSPLSGPLYLFYNAPLLDVIEIDAQLESTGYADDITFIAKGASVEENRETLTKLGNHTTLWATRSSSTIATSKTVYTYYTKNRAQHDDTPLVFGGENIEPAESTMLLGVELERDLSWRRQATRAAERGMATLMALARFARTTWGLPLQHFRRLYLSIVVPRMDYGAAIWYRYGNHGAKVVHQLEKVQRMAQRIMLGAFRTSPSDALNFDADLLPTATRLDRTVSLAAARLLSLPETNPARRLTRRCLRRPVKRHASNLHAVFHSSSDTNSPRRRTADSFAFPDDMETIRPKAAPPWWETPVDTHIAKDRGTAIEDHANLVYFADHFHLYSDGSKTQIGVGAAAVDLRNRRTLRTHLGTPERHTVFEAELVGIYLALELIESLPQRASQCSIYLDNQAAITAVAARPKAQSGQYIIAEIHKKLWALQRRRPDLYIVLTWLPGHEGIPGNEAADKQAKEATTPPHPDVPHSDSDLELPFRTLASLAATREAIKKFFVRPSARTRTGAERTGERHRRARGQQSSTKTLRLLSSLPRGGCSIIVQLRTGHVALKDYLHRFTKASSGDCITCRGRKETVEHYLLFCTRYINQRMKLRTTLRKIESIKTFNPMQLSVLLSDPAAVPHTLRYIQETRRFPLHTPDNATEPRSGSKRREKRGEHPPS
ncbi:hypothetical protein FRC04_005525 [Tulasnella sp. 424]|nr:hypothetical protein FRC04_005525 [Tulasnella sp. 424]KAG8970638.1 hypothetical protein FRC05_000496 [Tulasnella sp. 425]